MALEDTFQKGLFVSYVTHFWSFLYPPLTLPHVTFCHTLIVPLKKLCNTITTLTPFFLNSAENFARKILCFTRHPFPLYNSLSQNFNPPPSSEGITLLLHGPKLQAQWGHPKHELLICESNLSLENAIQNYERSKLTKNNNFGFERRESNVAWEDGIHYYERSEPTKNNNFRYGSQV